MSGGGGGAMLPTCGCSDSRDEGLGLKRKSKFCERRLISIRENTLGKNSKGSLSKLFIQREN